MKTDKKVLLLYPEQNNANSTLKQSLQQAGAVVEELIIKGNIEQVLDALEKPVTPVVIHD